MKKQLLFIALILALSLVGCTSMEKGTDKMMDDSSKSMAEPMM